MLTTVACLSAVLVSLPSLSIGLIGDDHWHREFLLDRLHGLPCDCVWWNLFENHRPVADQIGWGLLPWWSSPQLSITFLRPLATLSQYIDYLLWPNHPALMHAHNIAIFALIAWVVSALYRRLLSGPAVWLATCLYVLDDANSLSAAWIASRNTLLTALFGLLTLWLYIRARADASRLSAVAAPVTLLLAHACSEGAAAIWAYLGAYAWFLDRGPWQHRARALMPLVVISIGWFTLSSVLGYGVHGSGSYVDPRTSPLAFLTAVAARLPVLLLTQFGLVMELQLELPAAPVRLLNVTAGLSLIIGSICVLARWRTRSPELRFFVVGCLLSLLPICAVGTVGRLLFLSGFGAHALIAQMLVACFRPQDDRALPRWLRPLGLRALATWLIAAHTLSAAVGAYFTPQWWERRDRAFLDAALSLPRGKELERSMIMLLNTRNYLTMPFVLSYRNTFAKPGPPIAHLLGVSTDEVMVFRPDDTALELTPRNGYLSDKYSVLVRSRQECFEVGQVINLYGAYVRVQAITPDGRPAQIRVQTFGLDDPRLLWVAWNDEQRRFDRVQLPRVGETLILPAVPHAERALEPRVLLFD